MRLSFRRPYSKSTRLNRAAYWLLLCVLTLQLIGMGFHHHDLSKDDHDCTGCYLSLHVQGTTPSVATDIAVTLRVLRYEIHRLPIYRFIARRSYLIPLPLAPPSF